MTRYIYHIEVDRIVIQGAETDRVSAAGLRAMTGAAIEAELANAPLPGGRTMREAVRVIAPSVAAGTDPAIARAISHSVTRTAGGGPYRG